MVAFFAPRGRKQPPARAENAPIRPAGRPSLLKEDFALTRIGIKPACQQGDVILQISKGSSAGGWAALAGCAQRSYRFEEFAQPLFPRSRLRRGIGKFEDKRVYYLSAAYPENSNGAFRLRTHDDCRMKLFDRTNDIGKRPLQILDSFQALVQSSSLLEIEFGAGRFALAGQGIGKRTPSRTQISSRAVHLFRIFGNGAPPEAGRQAHFHLGIDASGKIGIAADFDLAAANSKKIEPTFKEAFRCASGGKGTQIQTRGAQTTSDIRTRIGVRQVQLYKGRRVETQALAIVSRPQNSCLLPMHRACSNREPVTRKRMPAAYSRRLRRFYSLPARRAEAAGASSNPRCAVKEGGRLAGRDEVRSERPQDEGERWRKTLPPGWSNGFGGRAPA